MTRAGGTPPARAAPRPTGGNRKSAAAARRPAPAREPLGPAAGGPHPVGSRYLAETERPWVSLVFVLPLVLAYEGYATGWVGPRATGAAVGGAGQITAFVLIDELFALFGATGRHLPAIGLVAMLLSAHLVRGDRWTFHPRTLLGMAGESVFWTAPLVVVGWGLVRLLPLHPPGHAQHMILLSLGAGLYEEMLFRLIGVSAFILILQQGFGFRSRVAYPIVLIGLGLLFSAYHYLSPHEHFASRPFLFRTLAGCYLGIVYVLRGFGVTSGTHAVYDMAVGLLSAG